MAGLVRISKRVANQKAFGKVYDTRARHAKNVSSKAVPKKARMLEEHGEFKAYQTNNAWVTVQYQVEDVNGNRRTVIVNMRPKQFEKVRRTVERKGGLLRFLDITNGDVWSHEVHGMSDEVASIAKVKSLIRGEGLLKAAVAHKDLDLAVQLKDALARRDIPAVTKIVDDFELGKTNQELSSYYKYEDILDDIIDSIDIL